MKVGKFGLLVAFLLLTNAAAQTTVTFWSSFSNEPMLNLVAQFEEEHPDIDVELVEAGNYNEMITRLQAAVVSGRLPDVVMLEITRYGIFADRGVLASLEPLMAADETFNRADLIDGIEEATLYDGVPFVIPFNNSVPVMYYNKDMFAEAGLDPENPPNTWQELLEVAQTLTVREGDTTLQWGLSAPPQWVRHAFVRQNGGDWMDASQSELTLNAPEAVEAYQFLYDLIYEYEVGYPEAGIDANEAISRQDFLSGRTGIVFNSTGSLGGLAADATFDLGVAPLPCDDMCAAPIGGATLGIIADIPEARLQAAWTFLSWMTNTENNAYWHTATGYMPIRESTLNAQSSQDFYAANPNFKVAIDQFQAVSFPRPRPPAMPAIRQLELTTWEEIITQAKTIQEALDDLTTEANILLQEN